MKNLTLPAVGALALALLGAAPSASAGRPKVVVGVYTQSDAWFSETVTLYGDGKYRQEEKPKGEKGGVRPARGFSLHDIFCPDLALPASFREPKREGAWRVLDGPGGAPVLLKPAAFRAGAGLPPGAVVELRRAMPFGLTWDNQSPYGLSGDRAVAAGAFRAGTGD